MIKSVTDLAPFLADEIKAQAFIRDLRWPEGVRCAFCDHSKVYALKGYVAKKTKDGQESNAAPRLQWKCGKCGHKFSVTSKSIFEGSHVKLGHWIYAIFQMCSSKKGVSANQLCRELNIHYRSAHFLCHRVREAMKREPLAGMLGKDGGIVELDETYVGGKAGNNLHRNKGPKATRKEAVMTIIERDGDVKSVHVQNVRKGTLQKLAKPIVDRSANIMTDAHLSYDGLDQHFHSHHVVDHSKHFVRGIIIHTNFAESYHSLLKRAIIGTFHHVSDKHLHRYLSEFDYRWNTRKDRDGDRTEAVIKAAPNKRLTYRTGENPQI
jgi:transposase-like protein